MLLDFLHLSRNKYVYFRNRASKVGMLHWIWWVNAGFRGARGRGPGLPTKECPPPCSCL